MKYPSLFERLLANSEEDFDGPLFRGCPCWCWTGTRRRRGYGVISMRIRGQKNARGFFAHRIMAKFMLGRELHSDDETVEHECEIPWCINPWHLALASRAENTADARARRLGRKRRKFRPLLDPAIWFFDPLADRCLPVLRSAIAETADCPF